MNYKEELKKISKKVKFMIIYNEINNDYDENFLFISQLINKLPMLKAGLQVKNYNNFPSSVKTYVRFNEHYRLEATGSAPRIYYRGKGEEEGWTTEYYFLITNKTNITNMINLIKQDFRITNDNVKTIRKFLIDKTNWNNVKLHSLRS